jgi:aspartate/methionine/tyrosine aminotransferase
MREEYRARRELVVSGLDEIPGVSCRSPRGAFYAFPNVSALPLSEHELAHRLLEEAGVAVLAGTAFGRYGAGHLRISYATAPERLELGLARMRAFVETL